MRAHALPERLPDAGLVWLDGVAHLPHLEAHEETLELMKLVMTSDPSF